MSVNFFVGEVIKRMNIDGVLKELNSAEKKDYYKSIKDRVFLFIQNDRASMKEYMRLIFEAGFGLGLEEAKKGSAHRRGVETIAIPVNAEIGMILVDEEHLNLKNCIIEDENGEEVKDRCKAPLSVLIKTYTRHYKE